MNNANKKKRYHWFKLTEDFLSSEKVDYLVSQDSGNGFAYVMIYQCLCLLAINTGGELVTRVEKMVIPFTVEKIKRDLKWFSLEQIEKALDLFSKLGLVSTDKNGFISITNFSRLIGNETYGAAEKRSSLQAKKELAQAGKLVKLSKERYILPSGDYYYIDHVRYGGNGDKVLKRSNGLCEMCGSTDGIRIHHNNGYSNAPEDLVVLCYGCHGIAHSKPNNGRLKLPHKNEIERVKSEK